MTTRIIKRSTLDERGGTLMQFSFDDMTNCLQVMEKLHPFVHISLEKCIFELMKINYNMCHGPGCTFQQQSFTPQFHQFTNKYNINGKA